MNEDGEDPYIRNQLPQQHRRQDNDEQRTLTPPRNVTSGSTTVTANEGTSTSTTTPTSSSPGGRTTSATASPVTSRDFAVEKAIAIAHATGGTVGGAAAAAGVVPPSIHHHDRTSDATRRNADDGNQRPAHPIETETPVSDAKRSGPSPGAQQQEHDRRGGLGVDGPGLAHSASGYPPEKTKASYTDADNGASVKVIEETVPSSQSTAVNVAGGPAVNPRLRALKNLVRSSSEPALSSTAAAAAAASSNVDLEKGAVPPAFNRGLSQPPIRLTGLLEPNKPLKPPPTWKGSGWNILTHTWLNVLLVL